MRISIYRHFPEEAKAIREAVFVKEQGFLDEFDDTDQEAVHLILYDEAELPVATCRIFWNQAMNAYTLGRLAVIKEYRGKSIGSLMLKEAEKYVQRENGKELILHAQCRATDFYKKAGFTEFGDMEEDQGCPHIWMRKPV